MISLVEWWRESLGAPAWAPGNHFLSTIQIEAGGEDNNAKCACAQTLE